MSSKDRQRERFEQQCKEQGMKLTPQRLIIYDALIDTAEHPTVDMIYARVRQTFPTISLDTVHRTLVTFCEMGVASMVDGTGSPKRFEGNLALHHHARCVRCGKIVDFYNQDYDDLAAPPEIQQEFFILKKTVHIEGICSVCRQSIQ